MGPNATWAAELEAGYTAEAGYDSNYFDGAEELDTPWFSGELTLRGTQPLEGGKLVIALSRLERQVPRYHFADTHNTAVELGLELTPANDVIWSMELRGTHSDTGDLLLALPGSTIGYRTTTLLLDAGMGLQAKIAGGTTRLVAKLSTQKNTKAKFRPELFQPVRLDANETLLELEAKHAQPIGPGEVLIAVSHRELVVPADDRDRFLRYPASALRGSIGYAQEVAGIVTVLAETGATRLDGTQVGSAFDAPRLYLNAEAEWQATDWMALGAGYRQDYALSNVDDPIGEYRRTLRMVAKTELGGRTRFELALEKNWNEWVFYDYSSTNRSIVATLAVDAGSGRQWTTEFTRRLHNEKDLVSDYVKSTLMTRLEGKF